MSPTHPKSQLAIPSPCHTHSDFTSLPCELRLLILRRAHLLRPFDWVWAHRVSGAGANILDGQLLVPRKTPKIEPEIRIASENEHSPFGDVRDLKGTL